MYVCFSEKFCLYDKAPAWRHYAELSQPSDKTTDEKEPETILIHSNVLN